MAELDLPVQGYEPVADPNGYALPVAAINPSLKRVYIDTSEKKPETVLKEVEHDPWETGKKVIDKLFGLNGQERYQLWPEKIVREALSAGHDVMEQGTVAPGLRREDYTDIPSPDMPTKDSTWLGKALNIAPVGASPADSLIEKAQAVSALAGTGGMAGTGEGAALGSGPMLRPALKYKDKIYKAPVGGQHLDALPPALYDEFQKLAMSGEDINHYNFGFMNHKGQFLDREKALDYAVKEGLVDPHAGQYGALTSTLLADSSKPGTAIESVAKAFKVKGHENENWYHGTTHDFDKFKVAKGNIENYGGQYPHFTSNAEDASANYAGHHSPDLTQRIELRTEQLAQDIADKKYGGVMGDNYGKIITEAKAKATKEIAGPHEGAIIPANIKMEKPADITPEGKTWIDFNPKLDKEGEWVKDHPNMNKLLNSLKKQGEKYGFDGEKAFQQVAEKAELYNGDIKASDLHKALKDSEELMYAEHPEGKGMVGSHVAATVFKDLGFDGIVMDAKSAFPNMKIPEGTKHAIVLKPNTVQSKLTGQTLFADSSKPGTAIEAMAKTGNKNIDWNLIKSADENISGPAAKAIDSWVGGDKDFAKNGGMFGVWHPKALKEAIKSPEIKAELDKVMAPIKEHLKAEHGDTMTLYRNHGDLPEGAKPDRELLSFTSDKDFAENGFGAPKERKLYTEDEIKSKEKEFEETGKVEIGKNLWLEKTTETFDPRAWGQEGEPKTITYTAIMRPDGMVTDTPSVREYLTDINKDRIENNAKRDKLLKNVVTKQIPIDDIIYATDRFGQKEFIVHNKNKDLFSSPYTLIPVDHDPFEKKK